MNFGYIHTNSYKIRTKCCFNYTIKNISFTYGWVGLGYVISFSQFFRKFAKTEPVKFVKIAVKNHKTRI